jgi:hypothetical protein
MIGSIITAKVGKGFVGGYELDLLLLSIAVSLLLTGPGRSSIENQKVKTWLLQQNQSNNTTTNNCNSSNNNNIV